jgi:hypothetical protein
MEDFNKQKIIYPNMTKYLPFYYDVNGFMTNQKCFIITGTSLAFLTAFLNSKLFKFCFKNNFPELRGGTRELSKIFFERIPVIKVNECINDDFEKDIVNVQQMKLRGEATTTVELNIEHKICNLYHLSDHEINIVLND